MLIRKYGSLVLILFYSLQGFCKIIPANEAVLHYNTVYFEEEFVKGGLTYELVYFDSMPGSKRGELKTIKNKVPAFWSEALNWNSTYFWKVRVFDKKQHELSSGTWHQFITLNVVSQNKEKTRLVIKTNAVKKHAGGYISLDYSRSIYDRQGNMIWTIPVAESMDPEKNQIRDLKNTHDNTLTFLNGSFPLEIDMEGNILWTAPYPFILNSDTVFYHHDFKKTKRGTYMVMGNKKAYRRVLGDYPLERLNREFEVKIIDGQKYCKVLMTCILEFDKKGQVIWMWDANDYVTDEDLNIKKGPMKIPGFATHANAFSEDEAGTKVYVGFRDLSRIVKIDKQSKKVEQSYGEKYPSGEARLANNLFKRQHDASITKRHTLLLLNNNSPPGGGGGVSSAMEIKEEGLPGDSILVWKFDLNFDTLTNGKSISGGNMVELPNSNFLVCAGLLNRLFEVSRSKEIVWDAFVEAKKEEETQWRSSPQYRCNWIKELKWSHFLCELGEHKLDVDKGNYDLLIFNTGQQADSYHIELLNENGQSLQKEETKILQVGKNLKHSIRVNQQQLQSKALSVLVKSNHSADYKIIQLFLNH